MPSCWPGMRQAVGGDIDEAAPAIVDASVGQHREHRGETLLQDASALRVRRLLGRREARAATEQQT